MAEERNAMAEAVLEDKNEKLMMVKARQRDHKQKLDTRNKSLDRRWRDMKTRPATFADGNFSFYEPVAAKMDVDERRHWVQKQNLQRVVRKN